MLRWMPACDAIEKNVFFPAELSHRPAAAAAAAGRQRGSRGAISLVGTGTAADSLPALRLSHAPYRFIQPSKV
eukprot:COSAG02_NODE_4985_length_4749_cov_5.434409_4_plen_73_part_00